MSVLNRKLGRDLRDAKGLLLAIVSIIAIGVACQVSMLSAYHNLTGAKGRYYAQCRMADFWIDLKKIPVSELDVLAELPAVETYRPRIQFGATVDLEQVAKPINGLVLSLPDEREEILNDIVLERGSYFTPQRDNEVIVNEAFARYHRLRPGDWIHLILNDRRQELFVVGTAISSEFVYLLGPGAIAPDPALFGVFYLKHTYAEEVFDFEGAANQIVGVLSPEARQRPDDTLRQAEALLAPYGVFSTTALKDQASNFYLTNEIQGLSTFGMILPLIFLAVAGLVLNVLMTRLTEQQRTVVGTLKALGYGSRQVFWHFIKFGLVVGVAGGMLGCLLGYVFAAGMTDMYREFFEFPDLVNRVHFDTYAAGLLVSLLCAVVGTIYGARGVLRLQPAEAMRPKPPRRGGAIVLERITWLWRRFSFGWRLALRNVIRNRVRTAAGIFAAAMGASLLATGFMSMYSMLDMIDFTFEKVWRSDCDLTFKDERPLDALLEARRLPGVDYAEPTLSVACTFINGPYQKRGSITGVAPDARLTIPRDTKGRPLRIPPVGLVMTRHLAKQLHVEAGEVMTIRPIKGLRREQQVPLVQIADSYLGLSVYADIGYLSRLVGEEFAMTGVQLETDSSPASRSALFKELKRLPALQGFGAREDMIDNLMSTVFESAWVFILLLVLFAGIIFFGSILNSSLISLAERQREAATLQALGYTPWQIGALFLRESMIVNTTGALLGLPLGYLLMLAMAYTYQTDMFRMPVVAPPHVYVMTLVLAVIFALAAQSVVQRVIMRMDWLDALKTKE